MNIIFAGTSHFAEPALQALIDYCHASTTHRLVAVYTQPDRPKGRGQHLSASPIKTLAQQHALPVYQPITLKTEDEQRVLTDLAPDLMIVVAYGLLLPPEVLAIPTLGCINSHASLLPRWRGAAPIQRTILAGDTQTGITIMQMDAGLDTGDMLYQKIEPVRADDTYDSLHERLAMLSATCLIDTISDLENKRLAMQPQSTQGVCYAHKMTKAEGELDWSQSAEMLTRQIRAFNSYPVSFTTLQGKRIRVWEAHITSYEQDDTPPAGTIVAIHKTGLTVATSEGYIQLTALQLEGGKRLPVSQLLNGPLSKIQTGMMFESIK